MASYLFQHFRSSFVVAFALAALSGNTWSQQFQSDTVANVDSREARKLEYRVKKILRGDPFDAEAFNQWYSQLMLPSMTSPKPASLGMLAERRRDLMKDLSSAADNAAAHKALVDLVHAKATTVASGHYHPSVQYSFVYLLGQLNDQETSLSNRRPAVPLATAFRDLLKLAADEKLPDAVTVAALIGIHRHIELRGQFPEVAGEIPANEKSAAMTLLTNLTEANDPPKGRTQSGHDWMRSIAAESLGYLRDPNAIKSLAKLSIHADASLSARCAAVKAIGRLDLSQSTVNPAKLVAPIARLATDCCAAEQQSMSALIGDGSDKLEGRREKADLFGEESKGDGFSDPSSIPPRRRLLSFLTDIRAGLVGSDGKSGLVKVAGDDVSPLLQQVDATISALREKTTNIVDLSAEIEQHTAQLQKLAGSSQATGPRSTATK